MFLRLKAKAIAYDDTHDDNHIFLHLVAGNHYSAAINVASNTRRSRLAYVVKEYGESMFEILSALPEGTGGAEVSFDYWKNTGLKREEFVKADTNGIPDNDLGHRLIHLANRSMREKDSFVVVFGKKWGPEDRREYVFGFRPAQGLHDIHCNQSSPVGSPWREKDAPDRDGAIFFADAERRTVTGVFTMFV